MKVKLQNILPNPYRYLNKGYPIDKIKVDKLRESIKRTGFWDNLIGRESPSKSGAIEIAYGHHRLEALRKEFSLSYEIEIVIRDLDNATMLKIMAEENASMDIMSPMVINETVRATMNFLNLSATTKDASKPIAKYLNWPLDRIHESLAALRAFEKGEVSKEEYEAIPFQNTAEIFRQTQNKYPISKAERAIIVDKLKKGIIGKRGILEEFVKAKYATNGVPSKKRVDLEDISGNISDKLRDAAHSMTDNFIANSEYLSEEALEELRLAVNGLYKKLVRVKKQLGDKVLLLN